MFARVRAYLENGTAYGKKLRETPGFSRGGAAEIGFWIFAESLKIYGTVGVLVQFYFTYY